jgi:hypothetical protein
MMRKYFVYLDELRESGVTNMFGAPSYVVAMFGVDKKTALEVTSPWMRTFAEGKTVDVRVAEAEAARPS